MPVGNIIGAENPVNSVVRTEPIQQRSADRLNALLDAAAAIVDEIGFDRMTTAMIAERSGASIGTVYRYFPDRIAVLHALRSRAVTRFRARTAELISTGSVDNWWGAVDAGITAFVELYRNEPGFRIMHFVERERTPQKDDAANDTLAHRFAEVLTENFGLPGGEQLTFHLEITTEIADSLLSRAFAFDAAGDERYIEECRSIVRRYLAAHYGAPELVAG